MYFQQVREATDSESFALLTGADALVLASTLLGGDGLIGAGVNVVPDLSAELWNLSRYGNIPAARAVQQRIARVVAACVAAGLPAGFKTAVSLLGLCQPYPAFPLQAPAPDAAHRLAAELRDLGVRLAGAVV